jgi:hypothetical protein
MPRASSRAIAVALLIATVAAAPALAADTTPPKPQDGATAAQAGAKSAPEQPVFSVDMVMTANGETYTIRRTVDHEKTRMDMSMKGMESTQILLGDAKGTMYTLMPKEKKAMKQSNAMLGQQVAGHEPDAAEEKTPSDQPQGQVERIGQEEIDGHLADKYKITYEQGSGLMWIDAATNLPLRMESQGSVVQFKNYDFSPKPATLFEIPKGYEVTDMDEMMAKMPKGMGGMIGGMGKGMASGMAGNLAGGMGANLGAGIGGAMGGPIGAMVGQYVGQKIGQKVGQKVGAAAAGAVTPGK